MGGNGLLHTNRGLGWVEGLGPNPPDVHPYIYHLIYIASGVMIVYAFIYLHD
ncbi:hypothetical protein MtrunA17_Chr3g0110991 [Medicago truncatula]|uniref:Transmembrane protein n=1 Tax=Medicago truncatula TaxID=3880 RepID=A0A396IVZ8_MEDTR|nr:hypothetical protein MtrunA17_Chr3g0110991 [Medicago truncatula]